MAQISKESACNAGELGSIPGLGRSPGGGNGYPVQYSCLENPMDREAWGLQPIVFQSWIGLQRLSTQHARWQTSEDWRIQDLELKGQGLPEMLRS